MKSFIISLIILCIVTSAVFANAFFSDSICHDIIKNLSTLPDTALGGNDEMIDNVKKNFEKKSKYLSFVVSKEEIDELFCNFSDIHSYYHSGETPEYRASVMRAKRNIESVQKGEKPVWWSLIIG